MPKMITQEQERLRARPTRVYTVQLPNGTVRKSMPGKSPVDCVVAYQDEKGWP